MFDYLFRNNCNFEEVAAIALKEDKSDNFIHFEQSFLRQQQENIEKVDALVNKAEQTLLAIKSEFNKYIETSQKLMLESKVLIESQNQQDKEGDSKSETETETETETERETSVCEKEEKKKDLIPDISGDVYRDHEVNKYNEITYADVHAEEKSLTAQVLYDKDFPVEALEHNAEPGQVVFKCKGEDFANKKVCGPVTIQCYPCDTNCQGKPRRKPAKNVSPTLCVQQMPAVNIPRSLTVQKGPQIDIDPKHMSKVQACLKNMAYVECVFEPFDAVDKRISSDEEALYQEFKGQKRFDSRRSSLKSGTSRQSDANPSRRSFKITPQDIDDDYVVMMDAGLQVNLQPGENMEPEEGDNANNNFSLDTELFRYSKDVPVMDSASSLNVQFAKIHNESSKGFFPNVIEEVEEVAEETKELSSPPPPPNPEPSPPNLASEPKKKCVCLPKCKKSKCKNLAEDKKEKTANNNKRKSSISSDKSSNKTKQEDMSEKSNSSKSKTKENTSVISEKSSNKDTLTTSEKSGKSSFIPIDLSADSMETISRNVSRVLSNVKQIEEDENREMSRFGDLFQGVNVDASVESKLKGLIYNKLMGKNDDEEELISVRQSDEKSVSFRDSEFDKFHPLNKQMDVVVEENKEEITPTHAVTEENKDENVLSGSTKVENWLMEKQKLEEDSDNVLKLGELIHLDYNNKNDGDSNPSSSITYTIHGTRLDCSFSSRNCTSNLDSSIEFPSQPPGFDKVIYRNIFGVTPYKGLDFGKRKHRYSHSRNTANRYCMKVKDSEVDCSECLSPGEKENNEFSEGEVVANNKCTCDSSSIGEIKLCKYVNNIKSRVQYLKQHPKKLMEFELGNPNVNIVGKKMHYNNWYSYYVNNK